MPALAAVASAIDVRRAIVKPVAIHGGIRGARIEVRGFERRDLAPRCEFRRGDVLPSLPAIPRNVDEPIVSARPDDARGQWRWSDAVDHAFARALHRRIFRRNWIEIRRYAGVFTRQVRRKLLPALTAVGRLEQHLMAEVKRAP